MKMQPLSTEVYETVLDLYESGEGFEFGIMNDLYYQLFHGYEDPFDSEYSFNICLVKWALIMII